MTYKTLTPKVGVGVLMSDAQGRLLVGKRKGSHGAGQWALPGGHLELGEGFGKCCHRELLEETGIQCHKFFPCGFANEIFQEERLHYVTLFFHAEWDGQQAPELKEPDFCEGWDWKTVDWLLQAEVSGGLRSILEFLNLNEGNYDAQES